MRIAVGKQALGLVVGLLLLAACGKLSKDEARTLIKAKFDDTDGSLHCSWKDSTVDTPTPGAKNVVLHLARSKSACIDELDAAGVVTKQPCQFGGASCDRRPLTLGPKTFINRLDEIVFSCGKQELGEVTSISTEGKTATVTYKRIVTRDEALTKKLPDCALGGDNTGTDNMTVTFHKDDDGKWSM